MLAAWVGHSTGGGTDGGGAVYAGSPDSGGPAQVASAHCVWLRPGAQGATRSRSWPQHVRDAPGGDCRQGTAPPHEAVGATVVGPCWLLNQLWPPARLLLRTVGLVLVYAVGPVVLGGSAVNGVPGARLPATWLSGSGQQRQRATAVPTAAQGPRFGHLSGASQSTPSGGTVRVAEAGLPCHGSGTASTTPMLPTPLPP